jgi:hypothetical protein
MGAAVLPPDFRDPQPAHSGDWDNDMDVKGKGNCARLGMVEHCVGGNNDEKYLTWVL